LKYWKHLNHAKRFIQLKTFCIAIILCMGLSPVVNAQETAPQFTLDELLKLAEQNSLQLKIADLDKQIALADYKESRSLTNPEIEYSQGKATPMEEPGKLKIWDLGAKWSMPNPFHRYYLLKSLRADAAQAEIQSHVNKRNTLNELKTHFYKLQLLEKLKTFANERHNVLSELVKIAETKAEIGETKKIDAMRASVELQKSSTEIFKLEKAIAFEKSKIQEYVNFTIPESFEIRENFEFSTLPAIETVIQKRVESAPIIQIEYSKVAGKTASLKAARFSILESIELSGEKGKEIDGKIWKLGVGISFPLFNQNTFAIRKAKLEKEKAITEFNLANKQFKGELQQILGEIRVLEKEISSFQNLLLEEGKESLEVSTRLYREGEIPLVVFLDAQTGFYEIQGRYYEAITEWNIQKSELEALIGGLK